MDEQVRNGGASPERKLVKYKRGKRRRISWMREKTGVSSTHLYLFFVYTGLRKVGRCAALLITQESKHSEPGVSCQSVVQRRSMSCKWRYTASTRV
jgi:hypothetical protein